MFKHDYPDWDGDVNTMYYAISKNDYKKYARNRIHLNMKCGDTVFFHPYLIHGSSANLSNNTRRSMCVHFASTTKCNFMTEKHFVEKCDYVAPDYCQTLEWILKRKYNLSNSGVIDYWRLKSRVIKGEQGCFAMPLSYWKKFDEKYFQGLRPEYTNTENPVSYPHPSI